MRAVTVNVTESSGVGGLVAPGDHVDVYITRTPPEKAPHYDVIVPAGRGRRRRRAGRARHRCRARRRRRRWSSRAPRRGQADPGHRPADPGRPRPRHRPEHQCQPEKPELVKSATLEVTPAQVAKLTLGQTVGTLALALRPLTDTDHTRRAVAPCRGPARRPDPRQGGGADRPRPRPGAPRAAPPEEPSVDVVRGGEATHYTVPNP